MSTNGTRYQEVDPPFEYVLPQIDLSRVSHAERETRRLVEALTTEPIDVSAGPLFKSILLKQSTHEFVLALVADHIVSDAVSFSILSKEIWTLYDQGANGGKLSLPPLMVQFPDYAVWQETIVPLWKEKHENYWRERLSDAPETRIPHDYASADWNAPNVIMHLPLGKTLTESLRDVAARNGTPLALVVLMAYIFSMAIWCQRWDLVVGFMSHGRHALPQLKSMVGYVSTCVLLRVQLHDAESLLDVWQQIRAEYDNAFAHYDFDRVNEIVPQCATELGFNWISPLSSRNAAETGRRVEHVKLQPFPLSLSWAGDVFIFFADTPAGVAASVTYRPDRIARASIERFGRHLRGFAQVFLQQPSATVGSVMASLKSL